MPPSEPVEFAPLPAAGRTFTGGHRVRLGEVDAGGRLRLDAVVRILQDVANDDAHDSGIDNPGAWVVRRTAVRVERSPVLREDLALTTFCSGTGACWAERRTSVRGGAGARVEAVSLWVQLDPQRGTPLRLGPDFAAVYGPSSAGRRVKASLRLVDAPPAAVPRRAFALRLSDLDVMGHVNNAVYWAMLEELVGDEAAGCTIELEHHHALHAAAGAVLARDARRVWVLDGADGATVAAAARLLPPEPISP